MTPKPQRIRKWLVVCAALAVAAVVAYASSAPTAIWLALIPLMYTIPAFMWLDQLEPEPRVVRWNAFLWGAGISVLVASIANAIVISGVGQRLD